MSGPWYEMSGPSREYVYKDIMKHFTEKYMFTKNIGYNIMNYGYLSLMVKKIMAEEFDKYGGFGSYRGYATFARRTLVEGIIEKLKTRKLEIAFKILCNARIMHVLMNSVIYKPGTKRVKELSYKFNEKKNKKK
jgi:hypothetical protein